MSPRCVNGRHRPLMLWARRRVRRTRRSLWKIGNRRLSELCTILIARIKQIDTSRSCSLDTQATFISIGPRPAHEYHWKFVGRCRNEVTPLVFLKTCVLLHKLLCFCSPRCYRILIITQQCFCRIILTLQYSRRPAIQG